VTRKLRIVVCITASIVLSGCCLLSPIFSTGHDPQFLRVYYRNGLDVLDTFHGTYQKDLVEAGTTNAPMWLTTREQQILLEALQENSFFTLPDVIHAQPNVIVFPSHGPDTLRVEYEGRTKTVVWYWPLPIATNPLDDVGARVLDIRSILWDIIFSKPEYKALPPAKGGYQ